jgi:hypothetical protein
MFRMTDSTPSSKKPKTRKSSTRKSSVVSREINVSDWELQMFCHAVAHTDPEHRRPAETYLIVKGTCTEPFNGSSTFCAQIHAEDAPRIGPKELAAVGHVSASKRGISISASLHHVDFDRLLATATAGRLRYMSVYFQEPVRGSAALKTLGFCSEPYAAN